MKTIARAAAVAFSTAALALTIAPAAGAATASTVAPAAVTLAPAHHGGHHGWGGHHFRHWRDGGWYYDEDCNSYWFDGSYWHYGCED
jgi:hypothetical protein